MKAEREFTNADHHMNMDKHGYKFLLRITACWSVTDKFMAGLTVHGYPTPPILFNPRATLRTLPKVFNFSQGRDPGQNVNALLC